MAISTVTISGKVVLPSGAGADGGEIAVRHPQYGTVDDGGTEQVIAPKTIFVIGSDGSVSFAIIPNSTIATSSGVSFYLVTFRLADGTTWEEVWQVAASPSSQDIGDVNRVVAVPSDALPAAGVAWRGVHLTLKGGAGEEDKVYVCLKGSDDVYRWIPGLVGGTAGW